MKILVKDADIFNGKEFIGNGLIAIEDGTIIHCGSGSLPDLWKPDEIIDGNRLLALPGLINCHTHAGMTFTRGYADDRPLMTWLNDYIWPMEARLTEDDIYWGTMLGISEMLASGTTTFADMYFMMHRAAEAVKESGIRAVLSTGMIGLGSGVNKKLAQSVDFAVNWRGEADGRISTMLAPHAPYTCPPPFMKKVLDKAEKHQLPLHIHLAETRNEIEEIEKNYGKTPIEWANDLGVFNHPTLAAHCVHLSSEDMHILKEKGVGVAYNPQSNMKLASGTAPVAELNRLGVKVGFGTDGPGSNNSLDMFFEMKAGALLQKLAVNRADVLPANEVLAMVTSTGANILGLKDVGMLKKGMKADIILVDMDKPHFTPTFDPIAHMVYSGKGSDVSFTIVNGKILYEKGAFKTIDVEEVKQEVHIRAKRLIKG